MDKSKSPEKRADALVAAMSLDQKLHMLTFSDPPWFLYYGTAGHITGIDELCIPDLVLSDAGSGVAGLQYGTTTFPSGVAQASTWDPQLQRTIGRTIGAEAHAKGINVMLAPGMNIARTPYNGRNFEYFGEDPYLASQTAVSVIKGIQDNPVIADAKHYALNNQEIDRMTVDVRAKERVMREIYLPAFEASVKKADVGSVMCSYNKVGGKYACENPTLLTDYLRDDWGFDGFVVSDWGAVHSTAPSANAGLDLEMHAFAMPTPATPVTGTGGRFFDAPQLKAALADGSLSRARLDEMVHNIVRTMFRHGLFDHRTDQNAATYTSDVSTPHQAVARRAAAAATVMLKNRDGLLPLPKVAGGRTIAVIGWAAGPIGAMNSVSGGGSSRTGLPGRVVSPLEGITAQALENGDRVVYVDGSSQADAVAAAAAADLAVVVANDGSSEGADRPDLGLHPGICVTIFCQNLPIDQTDLIAAVTQANPDNVVVLDIGAPVKMPWLDRAGAVLVPWYAGLQHGNALADVLYGKAEPGGRLPQTFPVDEAQASFPAAQYPGVGGVAKYSDGLLVGYRAYDAHQRTPLFPFGFGLGYTTFDYRGLKVRPRGRTVKVSLVVRNTGSRAGAAVPQVYVGFPKKTGEPKRQLKGFRKVRLDAGESRRITIRLSPRAFAHWSTKRDSWVIEEGRYKLFVGPDSRTFPLKGAVRLPRTLLAK
ncbi:glycoside hydrolase family 3 C-terminal domain-containing protein [Nocardioides sp.]|uniref:glycoside hydrolase family 3 C-terminal domain-containing protein n=1 Tax=Nocardioides sp. TaxID=35761 RepID=UPI001A1BEF94|nr:glycoside hydrolase family 3 C-terminal domain-containing protein [Nocardioides sp.]MBJ7357000.1 glycoside hydrolase family 3 C-terminal domain-containing protein [Nocardioides sp.]